MLWLEEKRSDKIYFTQKQKPPKACLNPFEAILINNFFAL